MKILTDEEVREFRKSNPNIPYKCSNCGKISEHTRKEVADAFPFSRELLLCKHCGHSLSINNWTLGL